MINSIILIRINRFFKVVNNVIMSKTIINKANSYRFR